MGIITVIITAQTPFLRLLCNNRKKRQLEACFNKAPKHQKKPKNKDTKIKTFLNKRLALMS